MKTFNARFYIYCCTLCSGYKSRNTRINQQHSLTLHIFTTLHTIYVLNFPPILSDRSLVWSDP